MGGTRREFEALKNEEEFRTREGDPRPKGTVGEGWRCDRAWRVGGLPRVQDRPGEVETPVHTIPAKERAWS